MIVKTTRNNPKWTPPAENAGVKYLNQFRVVFSSSDGCFQSDFICWHEGETLDSDSLMFHMKKHDAENAGVSPEESAGFKLIHFIPENNSAVVSTLGLGPKPSDNVLMLVSWENTAFFLYYTSHAPADQ